MTANTLPNYNRTSAVSQLGNAITHGRNANDQARLFADKIARDCDTVDEMQTMIKDEYKLFIPDLTAWLEKNDPEGADKPTKTSAFDAYRKAFARRMESHGVKTTITGNKVEWIVEKSDGDNAGDNDGDKDSDQLPELRINNLTELSDHVVNALQSVIADAVEHGRKMSAEHAEVLALIRAALVDSADTVEQHITAIADQVEADRKAA